MFDDQGNYVIPEPTQADVDLLASQLAVLDPNGEGITQDKLRAFYPRLGWGHLQKRFEALEKAGRIKSDLRSGAGPVQLQYWTLVK